MMAMDESPAEHPSSLSLGRRSTILKGSAAIGCLQVDHVVHRVPELDRCFFHHFAERAQEAIFSLSP